MPHLITPAELDADCIAVVNAARSYSPLSGAVLEILYSTGCREGEALDRERWLEEISGAWKLQPQKHNPARLIPLADMNSIFIAYLGSRGYPTAISSLNNLRRLTRIFSAYPNATCGDKGISSHRYRHNKIKKLYASGASLGDIKVIMGLVSSSIIQGYIDSEIYQ